MYLHIQAAQSENAVQLVGSVLKEKFNLSVLNKEAQALSTTQIALNQSEHSQTQYLAYIYPADTYCKTFLEKVNPVHLAITLIAIYTACVYTIGSGVSQYNEKLSNVIHQITNQLKTKSLMTMSVVLNANQLNHFINLLNKHQSNLKILQNLAYEPNATNIERTIKKTLKNIVDNTLITVSSCPSITTIELQEFSKLQEEINTLHAALNPMSKLSVDLEAAHQESQATIWYQAMDKTKQFLSQFFQTIPTTQQQLNDQEIAALSAVHETTIQQEIHCLQNAINTTARQFDNAQREVEKEKALHMSENKNTQSTKPMVIIPPEYTMSQKANLQTIKSASQDTSNKINPKQQVKPNQTPDQKEQKAPASLPTENVAQNTKTSNDTFFVSLEKIMPSVVPIVFALSAGTLVGGLTYFLASAFTALLLATGAVFIVFTIASFVKTEPNPRQTNSRENPISAPEKQHQLSTEITCSVDKNNISSNLDNASARPEKIPQGLNRGPA